MKYKITSITDEALNLVVEDRGGVVKTIPLKNGESATSNSLTTSMRVYHRKQMVELFEVEEVLTGTDIGTDIGDNFSQGGTMTDADPNTDEILDRGHDTKEEIVIDYQVSGNPLANMTAEQSAAMFPNGIEGVTVIGPDNINEELEKAQKETEAYVVEKQINGEGEKVGLWTEEEEKYIKRYYGTKGGKFVAEKLNRSYKSVQKKVARLGLKKKKKK